MEEPFIIHPHFKGVYSLKNKEKSYSTREEKKKTVLCLEETADDGLRRWNVLYQILSDGSPKIEELNQKLSLLLLS